MVIAADYYSVSAIQIPLLNNLRLRLSREGFILDGLTPSAKWFLCTWIFVMLFNPGFAFASQSLNLLSSSAYIHVQDLSCIDDYMLESSAGKNWQLVLDGALDQCLVNDKSQTLSLEVLRLGLRGTKDRPRIVETAIHNIKTRYAITFIFLHGYCRPLSVKECAWDEALGIRSRRLSSESIPPLSNFVEVGQK